MLDWAKHGNFFGYNCKDKLKTMNIKQCDILKKIFLFFAMGIIGGFFIGAALSIYIILLHNYVSYNMFYLAMFSFQKQVNTHILIAMLICLLLLVNIILGNLFSQYINWPKQNEKQGKFVSLILTLFLACGWFINKAHIECNSVRSHLDVLITHDIPFVVCGLLIVWIFMKLHLTKIIVSFQKLIICLTGFSLIGFIATNTVSPQLKSSVNKTTNPNIILISLDALRADHMGCYGYARNTTPHIDTLARESVLFKNAFSHEPWTLPSHMSILTGLYPITHGVYDWKSLHPRIPTLTEYLKNIGYITIGFANSLWMTAEAGFGKGFDRYFWMKRTNYQYHKYIIEELAKIKSTPFFVFIHYFYVHSGSQKLPYDAPSPFDKTFGQLSSEDFPFRVSGIYASDYLKYINKNRIELSQQERQYLIDLYDNAVAYTDHCIGDLISNLRNLGLYDNTMIIITADHGEEFQEHGYVLHSNPYYYDGLIRVPLILKLPKSTSFGKIVKVIESPVELIDIMPSILEYLKIQPIYCQGNSFLSLLQSDNSNDERYAYGLPSTQSLYIRSKTWKLMSDDGFNRARYLMFNLIQDPHEQHSVVNEYPEVVTELENKLRFQIEESLKLRAYILGKKESGKETLPNSFKLKEQDKEKLKSLGYIL